MIEFRPPYDQIITEKWDMWGLGVILYALFCGCLPFTKMELMNNRLELQVRDGIMEG